MSKTAWFIIIGVVIVGVIIFFVMKNKKNTASQYQQTYPSTSTSTSPKFSYFDLGQLFTGAVTGYKLAQDEAAAKEASTYTAEEMEYMRTMGKTV